ncbi:Pantoate-beta-alanine ligase [Limtongia smithiae]|uniref:Pantoate-beta-alanine ligase n=1 Tax=Limtongia smithiae TaxID=1125753 RepID=UPI0034CE041E
MQTLAPVTIACSHMIPAMRSFAAFTVRYSSTATAATAKATTPESIAVLRTRKEVRAWRNAQLAAGLTVGFVPTMGALHEGHLSLVRASTRMNDKTIVSIFVNPSQFAPNEDLASYPRDLDADVTLLSTVETVMPLPQTQTSGTSSTVSTTKVDVVFAPSVEEMYPSGIPLTIADQRGAFVSVEGLSHQLEGSIRPQFFRGVATVVSKLLNVVSPDLIYFGQKDVQQTVVVRRLIKDMCYDTGVVIVPTTRDASGLALSSRNAYLSAKVQEDATVIYRGLQRAVELFRTETSAAALVDVIVQSIAEKFPLEDIEYVKVNDSETLKELDIVHPLRGAIVSLAVRVPNKFGTQTRLIDNVIL